MKTIVGIFKLRRELDQAVEQLRDAGMPPGQLSILYRGEGADQIEAMPQTAGEQPGMGMTLGAVVGGAAGAAAGMGLPAIATLAVPGLGPILAIGTAAAAILGLGGAVGGAVAGGRIEEALTEGMPADEAYLYADALRKGRSIVVVLAENEHQIRTAEATLKRAGAESIDSARERWWIGLRDAEKEHFTGSGMSATEETLYRKGFEAAQKFVWMGNDDDMPESRLRQNLGPLFEEESFKRGFERGRQNARLQRMQA